MIFKREGETQYMGTWTEKNSLQEISLYIYNSSPLNSSSYRGRWSWMSSSSNSHVPHLHLRRLTDGKMNLILPLKVCCKCMWNGDAKETLRKETWAQEWGQIRRHPIGQMLKQQWYQESILSQKKSSPLSSFQQGSQIWQWRTQMLEVGRHFSFKPWLSHSGVMQLWANGIYALCASGSPSAQ